MLDRFGSTTSTLGFFEGKYESVATAYLDWQRPILARFDAQLIQRDVDDPLETVLSALLPLTAPLRERFLFLETRSAWTAFLDNFWRGTDAAAPVHYLSKRLGTRGIRVTVVADDAREDAGTILEVCEADGSRRSIFCARDGNRWKFGENGTPLDIEDLDRYKAKRVKDRFPPQLAMEYLAALGVQADHDSFFEPEGRARGILLSRKGPRPDSFREHERPW